MYAEGATSVGFTPTLMDALFSDLKMCIDPDNILSLVHNFLCNVESHEKVLLKLLQEVCIC